MKILESIKRKKKLALTCSVFTLSALYYGVVVSPEYQSTTSFVVKEISSDKQIDTGLGLLSPNGMNETAPMIMDYAKSHAMAKEILENERLDFKRHMLDYATPLIGVKEGSPFEKFHRKLQDLATVALDPTSNVYTLSTSAYDPSRSKMLNEETMVLISSLINTINRETAKAKYRNAEAIAADVKEKLDKAELELKEFQAQMKSISPIGDIKMVAETIAALRSQLVTLETEYQSKKQFISDRHPDMKSLISQIDAIEKKLVEQREISVNIPDIDTFNDLKFNVEMLTKGYQVALSTSLKEKSEASKEGLVLMKISPASEPEEPSYPKFFYHSIGMTIIIMSIIWLLSMLSEATSKGRGHNQKK